MGGGAGVLLAGVAVAFVVVTNVNKVQVAVYGGGGGGQAHAVGGAIAGEGGHQQVVFRLEAFFLQ